MIAPELLPDKEPTVLPVKKGGLVFLHGRTPHGSLPNLSRQVRWSLDLRWNDALKPCGRPLPGMLVRSQQQQPTTYSQWLNDWAKAKADNTPRKMYRWEEITP